MIDLVIFSKNRACQLDSLLRSIKDHFLTPYNSIKILYKYDRAFESGYKMLKDKNINPNTLWVDETNFRSSVINTIKHSQKYIMFLVDDDVFYRPCSFNCDMITKQHAFLSTRLSYKHNYLGNESPSFTKKDKYLEWNWHSHNIENAWGYPFSVDGNVFETEQIKSFILETAYNAPNTFEGNIDRAMYESYTKFPLGLCLEDSCLFNNPLNIVQSEAPPTQHGRKHSAWSLNDLFLNGKTINNKMLYEAKTNQYHFLIEDII